MQRPSVEDMRDVVREARAALSMRREDFAALLGGSYTTVGRWERGESTPSEEDFIEIARQLQSVDRDLAERAASMALETLASLGIEQPPPGAREGRPPTPAEDLTDVVVCAAAEACRGTPADLRAPLLAAFRKARQLGLYYDEMESALEARLAGAATPAAAAPGESLGDARAKKRSQSSS